jgi:predicted ATP-grasp superfamily ATP-dependent carboligase
MLMGHSGDPGAESFDVLVLDAGYKQSLASARSLGRAGLRVALGESLAEYQPPARLPAFTSRHCARSLVLPSYVSDLQGFTDAVLDFLGSHPTRVVLPTGDATIAAVAPMREKMAALGTTLALAPDSALEIAINKARTLQVALELGIAVPRSIAVGSTDDLPAVVAEFGFPFVLKPTISWTGKVAQRVVPTEVINMAEAVAAAECFLAAGSGVLAQEWACGRREGVTLFIRGGDVLASCGHVEYRTTPPLGGASVMRESIQVPDDILEPAERLAKAMGLQGVCVVEFRRNSGNHPLLMEVNPRLAGTTENSIKSGVDLPMMIWQWATGAEVEPVTSYRTGVRTRWLQGDLRWLRENLRRPGRPDSVPRLLSFWIFASEFARTWRYDFVDLRDPRPAMVELRSTAASGGRLLRRGSARHQLLEGSKS